jgi:hypothetical protein
VDTDNAPRWTPLSDEEFGALSLPEKIKYLQKGAEVRNTLNRQLDAMLEEVEAKARQERSRRE